MNKIIFHFLPKYTIYVRPRIYICPLSFAFIRIYVFEFGLFLVLQYIYHVINYYLTFFPTNEYFNIRIWQNLSIYVRPRIYYTKTFELWCISDRNKKISIGEYFMIYLQIKTHLRIDDLS